jgi:hypothetical protein
MRRRGWVEGRLVAFGGAVAAGVALVRARYLRWGATDDELKVVLPGDELVPVADLTATRAVTVRAATVGVWPWIAQLGQGRGGFYSYDFLENLVGCDIHSAERVVPEWQSVEVGDAVHLHPEVGLIVAVVEPGEPWCCGAVSRSGEWRLRMTSRGRSCCAIRRMAAPGSWCGSVTGIRVGGRACSSSRPS